MNKALIIYDNTGFIYNITYGTDKTELPILSSMITDVQDGKNINSIDVSTDPPSIIYDDIPSTEMADIKNSVEIVNNKMNNIMEMLNVLTAVTMGGLTDGQIPADQYDDEEQPIEEDSTNTNDNSAPINNATI